MISVIMPTLWRGEHYKKMLPIFNDHPLIGEIIIIDNDPSNTDRSIFELIKVRHYAQIENIYVNPAWNLGVQLSECDQICLYSDDVLFDPKCIEEVAKVCTPRGGIAGFAIETISESHDVPNHLAPWEQLRVTPTPSMHYRFGICMFMHRESYMHIPDQLKIYYGDTYLFDQNVINGRSNFRIEGCPVITKMRTSSKSREFTEITVKDAEEYAKLSPTEGMILDFAQQLAKEYEEKK